MALAVVSGAQTRCTFGVAPGTLNVAPTGTPVLVNGMPIAKITDNVSIMNITPFGMCLTLSNPQVAAATSAALGVFTPMPCIPVIASPWMPGSVKALSNGTPVVNQTCTCMCAWGGVISITNPGQTKVTVP